MAANVDEEIIAVDENFDFEKHLENCGFKEYNKIKEAIENDDMSLEDILDLNENEIKKVLAEYGVTTIQTRRFVKAIKKLPQSKISDNSNDTHAKTVLLSEKEQKMINQFSETSDRITQNIMDLGKLHTNFKQKIKDGKDRLTLLYNNAMQKLTNLETSEEKEYGLNVELLKSHQKECNELRKEYEAFIISNDKINVDKSINIEKKINDYKMKIVNATVSGKCLNLDINLIKVDISNPEITNIPFRSDISQPSQGCNGGILSICGLNNKILNNGKTFHSNDICLARTSDNKMVDNSGVYKIKWKINILKNRNKWSSVGICTDDYQPNTKECGNDWYNSKYYIGWCGVQDNICSPNRLLCGDSKQNENIFYKSCQFIGDTLPQYVENDTISLIYDSNKNELLFELNDKQLNSKLVKVPIGLKLCWFAAKSGKDTKFTIVN